jgi:prepilin peptidase CpaA
MHVIQVHYLLILSGLLLIAVYTDLRTRRIPNRLIMTGVVLGFVFQFMADKIYGVFPGSWGGHGLLQGLYGLLAGLGLFMPFYLIRGMGAGDVKLLAMIGVWLGPEAVLNTALLTMVVGGALALGAAIWQGALGQVMSNVWFMLTHLMVSAQAREGVVLEAPARSTGRLPYALAIASGAAVQTAFMVKHYF